MNELRPAYNVKNKTFLWNLGLFIFISILVFNGTFFRIRPEAEIPEIDWLVLARLLFSLLGFLIGSMLLLKNKAKLGVGSIFLCLFLAASFLSAITSSYPVIVVGYAIVLLGAGVLTMGLVYHAGDVTQLEKIEKIWLITMFICVLKDAVTSLIVPDPGSQGEIVRLGMGITHANQLSLFATLVFWLSFRQEIRSKLIWIVRGVLIAIIVGAISRISIAAFLAGGFVYYFMKEKDNLRRITFVLSCSTVVIFTLLTFLFIPKLGDKVIVYAKRGQTKAEVFAFTARTYIWQQALHQVPEAPLTGHGYGVTRFSLEPITWEFQASHCHNDLLEALFSLGVFGFIPLLLMYLYSLKWMTRFPRLSLTFSPDLALHAASVVVMLLVRAMFEPSISSKLLPFQPLFFYYFLILDREKHFAMIKKAIG